jgi:hypothetical protein
MLAGELGAQLPTGAGIHVFQVESRIDSVNPPNFVPDVAEAEFIGKTIFATPSNGEVSGHATGVGWLFYGNNQSIAPGISTVDAFWADSFLGTGFLRNGSLSAPLKSDGRVFNHSWVGSNSSTNLDALRRLDFVIETYDQLQVVGVNNAPNGGNPAQPLLASAYNAISVGLTNGMHAFGSTNVGSGLYTSGRTKPDLVAPFNFTSQSTPVVSAAAALLVQTAHGNPDLSNGAYDVAISSGSYTVQHAEASEVVKAALMAGASRADIPSYAVTTDNGLDFKWGAGELDVYNSYHIIAGGEQDSSQQSGFASQLIGPGFDYDRMFAYDDAATYYFVAGQTSTSLAATLAWNIDIAGGTGVFDNTATLVDFDLLLYEAGPGGNSLLASSESRLENTENIFLTGLTPGAEYLLEVVRSDGLDALAWDYGLAWNIAQDATIARFGDLNGDGQVDVADIRPFVMALTNRPTYDALFPGLDADRLGDVNRDGRFNNGDIRALAALLGRESPEAGELVRLAPAVPEPASAGLMVLAAVLAMLSGYRRGCGMRG